MLPLKISSGNPQRQFSVNPRLIPEIGLFDHALRMQAGSLACQFVDKKRCLKSWGGMTGRQQAPENRQNIGQITFQPFVNRRWRLLREITNIPFLAALAGALRRCNPLV